MMTFEVPGSPVSVNHYTGFGKGRRFLTKQALEFRKKLQDCAKTAMGNDLLLDKDIAMSLVFFFSDKRKRDIDNYSKVILDALEGIVYENDAQVSELHLMKLQEQEKPKIVIIIYPAKDRERYLFSLRSLL